MSALMLSGGLGRRILLLNVSRSLAALAGLGALSFAVYELHGALSWRDHSDQIVAQSNDTERDVIDLETGVRGYVITGRQAFLDPTHVANDVHGHAAGDSVLARIAEVCVRERHGDDLVARIGGDEFAIVLRRTSESEARSVAAGLERAVRGEAIVLDDTVLHARVAIGVASTTRRCRPRELVRAADLDMYARKMRGKVGLVS